MLGSDSMITDRKKTKVPKEKSLSQFISTFVNCTNDNKRLQQAYLQTISCCFWNNVISSGPGMNFKLNFTQQK
jgi:hypothetical protein